jgi:8-oxo-dGTP pyrophosphatase MutT (NUDIX family)
VDKVAWVLVRAGRLLVARNRGRELFYLPGGRREAGESDTDALVREIREELGVRILSTTMRPVAEVTAPRDGAPGLVRMRCYTAAHEGEPAPASEIVELAWVTADDDDRVTRAEQQVIDLLVREGRLAPPLTTRPRCGPRT